MTLGARKLDFAIVRSDIEHRNDLPVMYIIIQVFSFLESCLLFEIGIFKRNIVLVKKWSRRNIWMFMKNTIRGK